VDLYFILCSKKQKNKMKRIYDYINPQTKAYRGEATEITLDYNRKDYGNLNPVIFDAAEIDKLLQKIYNDYAVIPISCYIYEEEPLKTWYGWLRKVSIVLTAIQAEDIHNLSGLAVIPIVIIGLISTIITATAVIWGLTLVKQTSRIVFVEGAGTAKWIIPVIVIGAVIGLWYLGKSKLALTHKKGK